MKISDKTRLILREMELNTYESDAYITLLEGGHMTAMEVSQKADVPYSKIYDILNSLKDKGWIKSSTNRPFKYYPVSPFEVVAYAKLKFEEKYRSWEQIVSEELQPLYEKRELIERPDIQILHGPAAIQSKLEEVIQKATKEIMIALPEFIIDILACVESPLNFTKNTVDIKVMAAGKNKDFNFLEKNININEFRVRDKMFGGGVIVDEREAMLFLGEGKTSLIIWSNHMGLVRFAREYFQFLWDSSEKG